VALGSAAVLAAILLVAPSADATLIGSGRPAALPGRFTGQQLVWQDCGDDIPTEIRCATVAAPIDYRRPDAGALEVTFSKLATETPAKRRGVLFLNPGGPGLPGLEEPRWRGESLPRQVREQYDLIGFDPRGVGRSTPVSCGLTGDETIQLTPHLPENFDHDVAVARSVATKCAAAGPTVGHLSTRDVARDMDLIRVLLGEDTISYFGVSYGTYLGAVYTQLFPGRTDRVVLDSNIDPARAWRGVFQAMTVAAADDFERFTRWAATRDGTYHFGRTPAAVSRTFWKLAARVAHNPIDIDGRMFTEFHARTVMATSSHEPEAGAAYLLDLRRAVNGAPHELSVPDMAEGEDAGTSLYWSVLCNDVSTWPRNPQTYRDDVARNLKRYPLVGDMLTNITPCAFWSLPRTEPDLTVRNDTPVLIVQNDRDPATPASMGEGLHRALRGSRLVMVEHGLTHGAYGVGNACADDAVNAYLATGTLPANDVTCSSAGQG
jgi:pimeloyl-ACP methyl ester carboxylesterase